jgi:hypothetical protein
MWHSIATWVSHQVRSQHQQRSGKVASVLHELLPVEHVERVLREEQVWVRACQYSPLVTLWTFLLQVLSPDHSCRDAVARLGAMQTADGQKPCSPDTTAYCKARQRLPERVCARLARDVGGALHARLRDPSRLGGRPIILVDGSTVSMPDTPANQAEYPQSRSQKPGLGFPIARVVALISLACGTVLDLAIGPYAGKGTGETSLFRTLWNALAAGDVVLGDRYFATYWDLAMLLMRGVDGVYRQHQLRLTVSQRVRWLGRGDWLLRLPKPQRPGWMSRSEYDSLPPTLEVREVEFDIRVRGFRVKHLTLVTTLLDPWLVSVEELAQAYRDRWHAELDLRSIKVTMQMDVLRCKSPDMVRKEIWMHLLAYNLIRTVMAEAGLEHDIAPREVSFKGTLQTLWAYRALVEQARAGEHAGLYEQILEATASHRVGDRPNRFEPRAIKRRPKEHDRLTLPRAEAKRRLAA